MEQPGINLEVVDIVNATKIIEAAIERGTFKAAEMSGVATLYDKLSAFCTEQEAVAKKLAEEEEQTEIKDDSNE